MLKKIMLLGAAIAALAALAAPAAQAEGTVTNFLGEEAGSITASSENTVSETTGGNKLVCETVQLKLTKTPGVTGHYTTTDPLDFVAQGHKNNHADPECEAVPSTLTVKITEVNATVNIEGGGKGTANFSYTYDITHPTLGSIMCSFSSKGEGTANYTPTSGTVQIEGAMEGGPAPFCATEGVLKGTFEVADEFGEPTSIH